MAAPRTCGALPRPGEPMLKLSGVLACSLDNLRHAGLRQAAAGNHHIGEGVGQTDRDKVADRIVGQLLVKAGVERNVAQSAHEQRVAIRGCSRGRERTRHRSAARTVFDEDALPEALGKLSRQQPPHQIVNTARFIGHNDPHRPQGILRERGARGEQARSRQDNSGETGLENSHHRILSRRGRAL